MQLEGIDKDVKPSNVPEGSTFRETSVVSYTFVKGEWKTLDSKSPDVIG
jgi:hypothetical protein